MRLCSRNQSKAATARHVHFWNGLWLDARRYEIGRREQYSEDGVTRRGDPEGLIR